MNEIRKKNEKNEILDQSGRVLIVDDDKDVLMAARLLLKPHIAQVITETDPRTIAKHLGEEEFDVILLDMNFTRDLTSGEEGLQWLSKILKIDPLAVVVMITAFADSNLAVRAIKSGATDFVSKPWQNEKLLATISAAIKLRRSQRKVSELYQRRQQLSADLDQPFHEFIGNSEPMQQVFKTIEKVASTDANVLISGDNGTGKELVARAIHRQSTRSEETFVKVDMGAVTESLFESELFGHVKGAFTDARADRAGRFEVANGGTLFLDEVGNLSLTMQAKLLSVLQNRQVTRVGSNTSREVDIRLVCASNISLSQLVEQKKFRQDMLYRINTVEINLPPLRDRLDDIDLLAEHFLYSYATRYRKDIKGLAPSALVKLRRQRWPGNVRELQHAIERAVIMTDSNRLQPEDFPFVTRVSTSDDAILQSHNLEQVEQTVIAKVLALSDGNVSHAAEELGLTRASLYRRMQKYGL